MANKILIIGHDSSYSKNITNALHHFGLEKAILSHTYKMTPQMIGDKLLSNSINKRISRPTHPNLNNFKYNPYRQKTPKKNWNSLAFDILLANSDQPFWGWADSNAISLLEFWANFDEDMGFIIIYDNPKYIIKKLINNKNIVDENSIQKNIEDWLNYHQILLEFYQKNSNKCLLINGEQALQSIHNLLDLITKKIICTHKKNLFNFYTDTQCLNNNDLTKKIKEENESSINNIIDFFIEKLLQCDTKISSLFNEIQNISDISLVRTQSTNQLTLEELLKSSIKLKQQENKNNKEKKCFSEKEIIYQNKINDYKILLSKKQLQLQKIQQGSLDDINTLQLQLSIALEELTELYSQPKQLNNIEYTNNCEQIIELNNIKNQLKTYQEENILLTNQLNYTKKEYKMLNIQLAIALNELEQSFSQKTEKSINNNVTIKNNIIATANLETNRIKNQLSYKIGKKILESSKNPLKWPILPISPIIAYYEYKGSLPFLDLYQEQYEDEKVKKHLSYKLGNYFLKNIKKPLKFLFIPFGLAIIAAKHKNKGNKGAV